MFRLSYSIFANNDYVTAEIIYNTAHVPLEVLAWLCMVWHICVWYGFSCGSAGKESACNARYLDSIPGLGRFPVEGKCYLFQYSGEFHGLHSPWGQKESDRIDQLSLSPEKRWRCCCVTAMSVGSATNGQNKAWLLLWLLRRE